MHYVVIGAGPAGVVASETLRNIDAAARISLFSGEPEPPYSRMAIPYLMVGDIDESGTYLRKSDDHYQRLAIEVRHDTVTAVSPGDRQLSLASGARIAYDRLLLATGSRPLLPPVPGIDLPNVHTCWTLDDARHIVQQATTGAKVLLIGAGFIGCIVLEALAARGVDLTVVEMGERMVPRMMNDAAAAMIKTWCNQQGVDVHTGTQVTALESNAADPPLKVQLSNGQSVDCHLVISAAGVTPNLELLDGTGIACERGVLVDTYLQSSDPHVYAAGDCAQSNDFSSDATAVHAIQPVAVEQGRIAALNMAGRPTPYQGSFSMNVLDTLGLISASFGLWMGVEDGEQAELSDPEHFRYLNLQFQDDMLVGATSLGLTQHVGILRGLIQGQTRLGVWKERLLADPTRVVEAYLAMGISYR